MHSWASLDHRSGSSLVHATAVPWDTVVLGFRVAAVDSLQLVAADGAHDCLVALDAWSRGNNVHLLTCRLPADHLRESMTLEAHGFRFVETVLHPFKDLTSHRANVATGIAIAPATDADIARIKRWATRVFRFERYHSDPRIEDAAANARYGYWVEDAWRRRTASLLTAVDETSGDLCGFFLVQDESPEVNWLLTAIDPGRRGEGLGGRVWRAMLDHHLRAGARRVTTTISSRNVPVMGLYASLGFKYLAPEMTFHRFEYDA